MTLRGRPRQFEVLPVAALIGAFGATAPHMARRAYPVLEGWGLEGLVLDIAGIVATILLTTVVIWFWMGVIVAAVALFVWVANRLESLRR